MEWVILLHGLARTKYAMRKMENHLCEENYMVLNLRYPSTRYPVEVLAERFVHPAIQKILANARAVHFVTHSLGGIIIRYYLQKHNLPEGRIVMLAPPNQGSELAERLRKFGIYRFIYGPAGLQVGINGKSILKSLHPVKRETGIIAGNKPINPITAYLVGKENDGKVSVDHTKLPEMKDFLVVASNHTFIMRDPVVIEQTIHFLKKGYFKRGESAS